MIHLFWNYRGLRSDTVVRALHGLIRKYMPSMIFLSEMKMKDHIIEGVRQRMGYSNGFNVAPIGRVGGLSLWWNDATSSTLIVCLGLRQFMKLCTEWKNMSFGEG